RQNKDAQSLITIGLGVFLCSKRCCLKRAGGLVLSVNTGPTRVRMKMKRWAEFYNSVIEKPLLTSTIVLVCVAVLVVGLSLPYYLSDFDSFIAQILAEAHGMIFDIAVIGILIFWLNQNGEKRQRIRTYKDEIDDFRL